MCLLQLALLTHSHSYYAVKACAVLLLNLGVIILSIRLLVPCKPFSFAQGYRCYRLKTTRHASQGLGSDVAKSF